MTLVLSNEDIDRLLTMDDYIAVLESGEQLRVSRTYRDRLLND